MISSSSRHQRTPSSSAAASERQRRLPTTKRSMAQPDSSFPSELVDSLDLKPLLKMIASHTATARGRRALLALAGEDDDETSMSFRLTKRTATLSSRQRRAAAASQSLSRAKNKRVPFRTRIAASADEVRQEYDLVRQALLILQQEEEQPPQGVTLSPPNLYNASNLKESHPWKNTRHNSIESDDDEWLDFYDDSEFTLEDVLKAEQVIGMILRVNDWANRQEIQTWVPLLAEIGGRIDSDALRHVLQEIESTVEIVRVRSLTDPQARSTFQFRLSVEKFPVLGLLRKRQEEMEQKVQQKRQSSSSTMQQQLEDIQQDIAAKEAEILGGLSRTILHYRKEIDESFHVVAELAFCSPRLRSACEPTDVFLWCVRKARFTWTALFIR